MAIPSLKQNSTEQRMVHRNIQTVPERKQTMGVTSIYSGVASAVRNRFVDPRRPVKEFFFMRKQQKVSWIMASVHNKASYNALIHRVKAYNTMIHDGLVSILHNINYRQTTYTPARSMRVVYNYNILPLCMIAEQTETKQ